eukprot:5093331-Pyramimonas_sp.AAC.1
MVMLQIIGGGEVDQELADSVEKDVETWSKGAFKLMQEAAWSDTPKLDREMIEWATEVIPLNLPSKRGFADTGTVPED